MGTVQFIKENNAKQIIHPMGHLAQVANSNPLIISSGDGVYVTDIDGHRMVDGVGGLWNVNLGYDRKEIKDAIKAQVDKLPYYSIFNGTANEVSELRIIRLDTEQDTMEIGTVEVDAGETSKEVESPPPT